MVTALAPSPARTRERVVLRGRVRARRAARRSNASFGEQVQSVQHRTGCTRGRLSVLIDVDDIPRDATTDRPRRKPRTLAHRPVSAGRRRGPDHHGLAASPRCRWHDATVTRPTRVPVRGPRAGLARGRVRRKQRGTGSDWAPGKVASQVIRDKHRGSKHPPCDRPPCAVEWLDAIRLCNLGTKCHRSSDEKRPKSGPDRTR